MQYQKIYTKNSRTEHFLKSPHQSMQPKQLFRFTYVSHAWTFQCCQMTTRLSS